VIAKRERQQLRDFRGVVNEEDATLMHFCQNA
jgi:hypothetical protein